jgi:hypothetical protein
MFLFFDINHLGDRMEREKAIRCANLNTKVESDAIITD